MKVLSFSYCFPNRAQPTWGIFVLQRLTALARLVDLEVVSPRPAFPLWTRLRQARADSPDELAGLRVHRPEFFYFPGVLKTLDGRLYARGLVRWLGRLCQRSRPDLLDAHFVWPDGVGVRRLARAVGIPYAITLRGKIYPCLEDRSIKRQCQEALRDADAVISVSAPMAELAAELGVRRDRIHVIANGVNAELFRPMAKADARRRLGLREDRPLVVSIGHLKPVKGHEELIRALAKLPSRVQLVIVGGEPDRGAYRRRILALTGQLGLSDRVVLAGRQPYERIPLYLAAADASVLASRNEGCPNVVLESLACGRPVVATRVGAVPDILSSDDYGRTVPVQSPDALAEAIEQVLAKPWSAEALGKCPSVRTWDSVARSVREVFQAVLDAGRDRSTRSSPGEGRRAG